MVTLPAGRFWSFCCCAVVFGVITLKPEATSMLFLFWVLVCVLAQPAVSANSAAALIILNDIICFIILVLCRFAVVRGCFIGHWRICARAIRRSLLANSIIVVSVAEVV